MSTVAEESSFFASVWIAISRPTVIADHVSAPITARPQKSATAATSELWTSMNAPDRPVSVLDGEAALPAHGRFRADGRALGRQARHPRRLQRGR